MRLVLNGENVNYAFENRNAHKTICISDLFSFLDMTTKGKFVELNGKLYRPETFAKTPIEIIQFMGGGC